MTKHTPGPWYVRADNVSASIWRRPPSDLYEYGGSVAGDRPIASVHKGWYLDGAVGYPLEANARLIATAPDLLEALIAAEQFVETESFPLGWCLDRLREIISKATGQEATDGHQDQTD